MSLPIKRKLLIADDSVAVQKIVQLTFSDEGYAVTAVGDGRRALEQIEQDVPDVVLADVTMPELNGYQVCARIRRDERLRGVKVILLVGAFEPFNEAEARKVGADDFLTKPFQSIRDMVSKVGNLFGGSDKHGTETAEHEAIQPSLSDATPNDAPQAALDHAPSAPTGTPAATTDILVATTKPLPPPPADESSSTSDPSPAADLADFAHSDEPTQSEHADLSPRNEQDEPLAAEEFSHANIVGDVVIFDEKPFADDDDDRNIDVTPFDQAVSRDVSETNAVEATSKTETTDLFFGDDDAPIVDAYAGAVSVEPDEVVSHPDLENTMSDEPSMNLNDSSHAHDDASHDENALLDLDDFSAPVPQTATASFQSASAPEVADAADNDDGLLDLDIDVPSEVSYTGDAASLHQSSDQIFDVDEPTTSSASAGDERNERIPLDEIFPPRAPGEGETTELVLPEAMPVDAPSPFAAESNVSFDETRDASSHSLTGLEGVAPQIQTGALVTLDQLAPDAIEEIVRRVVEQMSERVVQEVAWEVVPALAERMIKRRLETDDGGL